MGGGLWIIEGGRTKLPDLKHNHCLFVHQKIGLGCFFPPADLSWTKFIFYIQQTYFFFHVRQPVEIKFCYLNYNAMLSV